MRYLHAMVRVRDLDASLRSTTSTPLVRLQSQGVTINRPPRDGRMAFVRSPDAISIELLQKGDALPPREPWLSMANTGAW